MLEKNCQDNINKLIEIAKSQNNRINLSIIAITLKCDLDDLTEILDYFAQENIEVVNEDVEIVNDISEGENLQVSPFDPSKIDIKMDRITVDSIIKRIKNDELEFDSSFQRKAGLWNQVQKSQLIESIILRIPLPAFYFDASDDDKWQIIDGLQRIGTIKEFVVDKSFVLKGMEFLKDLNLLNFDQLPRALQRRIEETNLNAYFVNPSTPKNVKFNIFKRINTGGLILEPQEIRNALYQGQASSFLLEMSKVDSFIQATGHSIKSERMLDREFCLRYVLATRIGFDEYNGNFDEYLNSGMEYLGKASKEELKEIKDEFDRVMKKSYRLFDKFAFRRLNEEQRRGPINKSLFEVWSYLINRMSDADIERLIAKKGILFKKYTELCIDYSFINDIKSTDKSSLKNKFVKVERLVNLILQGDANDKKSND